MKTIVIASSALALALLASSAQASTDGQSIDLEYKGNPCEKCWAKLSNSANGTDATPSSDTIYFHSEGEEHARAELRFKTYSSGTHSFTGKMTLVSKAGGRISVLQTFSEESGKPRSQIAIDDDGSFYEVQGGGKCGVTAQVGKTYTLYAKYDSSTGKVENWVDDHKCPVISADASGGRLYTKIGAYRTNSGSGSMTTKWYSWTLE